MVEIWKFFDDKKFIRISNFGKITNQCMDVRLMINSDGYHVVEYSHINPKFGKCDLKRVDRMVLEAFIDKDIPLDTEIRHINGDIQDDRLDNLQFVKNSPPNEDDEDTDDKPDDLQIPSRNLHKPVFNNCTFTIHINKYS